MSSRNGNWLRHVRGLVLLAITQCQPAAFEPETGGETHFLTACDDSPEACGTALACVCNVCTLPCDEQAACATFPNARCVQLNETTSCQEAPAVGRCELTCATDVDCSALSVRHFCDDGVCRAEPGELQPTPTDACTDGDRLIEQVSANEVVVLGDAFFASTHEVTAFLEDQARGAGLLEPGERYRDESTVLQNALALSGRGLSAQYARATAEGDVQVVLMNGGGADVLLGSCETVDAECPVITEAVLAAEELLAQMAEDGVARLLYVFYPDPGDPELQAKLDVLRPALQSLCEAGPTVCDWLDLRPRFSGMEDDYLQAAGLTLTSEGARVAAEEMWGAMQGWCTEAM